MENMENMKNTEYSKSNEKNIVLENVKFGYRSDVPTLHNISKQEHMKHAGGKWQRMDEEDYDNYVEELSQDDFIDRFGNEILLSYVAHLQQIQRNINEAIAGVNQDGNNLKGDVLKGSL